MVAFVPFRFDSAISIDTVPEKTLCSYGEKTRCGRSEKTTTRKIETKTTTFHGGREEKKATTITEGAIKK